MSEIRIYIEGGGDSKETKSAIRQGFRQFFANLKVSVIACGTRNQALQDFKRALKSNPEAINLLLVDSEEAVSTDPWSHLQTRDRWQQPDSAANDHCHLMVQSVESWLVADPETLASYYGQGFLRNALPAHVDIEAVPKPDVMRSLDRATVPTQKGRYRKIAHCSALLGRIDRNRVRQRARHCDRLLRFLEAQLS